MNKIIPYDDNLGQERATFITPNNEFYCNYSCHFNGHEDLAKQYLNGPYFDQLLDSKVKSKSGEEINIWQSSELTKEELEVYKIWFQNSKIWFLRTYSDYMVHVLGFDKVETQWRKAITTTSFESHIKYYNYYLMEWNIEIRTKMKYNKETSLFEPVYYSEDYLISDADREAEDEIEEIKRKVLIKDRHHFFK